MNPPSQDGPHVLLVRHEERSWFVAKSAPGSLLQGSLTTAMDTVGPSDLFSLQVARSLA